MQIDHLGGRLILYNLIAHFKVIKHGMFSNSKTLLNPEKSYNNSLRGNQGNLHFKFNVNVPKNSFDNLAIRYFRV
jgi:hypothetical protein